MKILPANTDHSHLHKLLLGCIAPRPVALASTVDEHGNPNLSPFSFFNFFGVNPTTIIFSPSRRNRDATTKDTLENIKLVPEVVINAVTFEMVNQVSLASTEYPKGVDEFIKAGLTKLPSEMIRPFRVKESPVQLECRVRELVETGTGGGAANLVICDLLIAHISDDILAEDGLVDQNKIRLVGRLSRDYYVKAFGDSLFEVEKPLKKLGIGIDALPDYIRLSHDLSGNELGQLGNVEKLPDANEIKDFAGNPEMRELFESICNVRPELVKLAKSYLQSGHPYEALKILMIK